MSRFIGFGLMSCAVGMAFSLRAFAVPTGVTPTSAVDLVARNAAAAAQAPATCNAVATEASIRACAAAVISAGGGKVFIAAGHIFIVGGSLPAVSYLKYVGTAPQPCATNNANDPGDLWTPGCGGTQLDFGGLSSAFAAKNTPLASPDSGTTAIFGFGLQDLFIENFVRGVDIGATNSYGLFHSTLNNLYFYNGTDWAVNLENYGFNDLQRLFVSNDPKCFRIAVSFSTYNPGNSTWDRGFCISTGNQQQGYLFEASNSGNQGSWRTSQLQANFFANSLFSTAATMTSGSTSITLASTGTGSQALQVGMPVSFSTTANGFVAGELYWVLSLSGSTVTLGATPDGTAIAATGSTATNLQTYGYPGLNLYAHGGGSQQGMTFNLLDLEGKETAAIAAEGSGGNFFIMPVAPTSLSNFSFRNSPGNQIMSDYSNVTTDFDAASAQTQFFGRRITAGAQRTGWGMWYDSTRATTAMQLASAGTSTVPDYEVHAPGGGYYIAMQNSSTGQPSRSSSATTLALTAGQAGTVTYSGSGAATWTLPSISNSSPATSSLGMEFMIVNASGSALTINTDGTQVMNGLSGKVSSTIQAGQTLYLRAEVTASGTLFWAAVPGGALPT